MLKKIQRSFVLCISLSVVLGAGPLQAELPPVYDADSLPQQLEGADTNAEWPPAPGQEGKVEALSRSSSRPLLNTESGTFEQRLRRAEQQIQNMQNDGSTEKLNALQAQIQSLQAQVEQLTHDVQQATSQQKSMYADLDKRVADLKESTAQAKSIPSRSFAAPKALTSKNPLNIDEQINSSQKLEKKISEQPDVAEEQQIYQSAYNLIKAKKYEEAVNTLQSMLKKYPSGQFASNAHYWLGELYGLLSKNDLALAQFHIILTQYPDSPRISDAQLKSGLIYAAQSKWPEAKAAFKKVINRYPGTSAARLASQHLAQMKQAGH